MISWLKWALVILVFLSTLLPSTVIFAEGQLCPPRIAGPNDAEELFMHEEEFTKGSYESSLSYFQDDLPGRLPVVNVKYNTEFWISYYNSLKFIKGYVLKQAALFEIEKTGKKGPAVNEFCSFVSTAEYMD